MLNDEDAPEEEGDNVYYLGLLFTLISLMFTLVELFGVDADSASIDERKIHILLQNFGIALTSTVAGIVGRVMVQNWQRSEYIGNSGFRNEPKPLVRPPMSTSTEDLKKFNRLLHGRIARDLTNSANALARFHRVVQRHASETDNNLRNHSEDLKLESAKFKDELQRNTEILAQELKEQAKTKLETVANSLETVVKQAEKIQSTSSQSLESLQQNFEIAAKQSVSLTQNVTTTYERIGNAFDRLESELEHASSASSEFGKSTEQAAQMTATLGSAIEKLKSVLLTLHDRVEEISRTLNTIAELNTQIRTGRDAEQTAVVVQQIGESLKHIAEEGAETTSQTAKAAESLHTLTQSISSTETEVKLVTAALKNLSNEAEVQTNNLRESKRLRRKFWKLWR